MKKHNNLYDQLTTFYSMSVEELVLKILANYENTVSKYSKNKKNGGLREIYMVDKNSLLWSVQKYIINNYFSLKILPDCAYGFKKGKSYFDFLNHHVSRDATRLFLKLDIEEFFDSIDVDFLIKEIVEGYEKDLTKRKELERLFLLLFSCENKLPQGFQSSPFLSNYYFFRADLRIQNYCSKLGYKYSRYADDIILSSEKSTDLISSKTISMIGHILYDFNLKLNKEKTKSSKNELSLNGFVVSSEVRLSQKKLKELRRVLFIIEKNKKNTSEFIIESINLDKNVTKDNKKRVFTKEYLLEYLSGNRSFLISSLKKKSNTSASWETQGSKLITRIEKAIVQIY